MTRRITRTLACALLLASCTGAGESGPSPAPLPPATADAALVESTSTVLSAPATALAAVPVRHPASVGSIYFVMTDRFENGDPSNDTGGIDGGPLEHGYLPDDTGFYQGGDLVGLMQRIDYIAELGMKAIWITPPFVNRPVQGGGSIENSSAGYHGYWQIDWSRIDPHLGSDEEMQAFIEAAHGAGLKVIFDIVVNHTGDVIGYQGGESAYRSKTAAPYREAGGEEFDDGAVAGSEAFPDLDPSVSFPYVPVFGSEADSQIKYPDWLDDVTMYHNRGNSTFDGESSTYGDFFGLDDLFTERPEVVDGMIELYSDVIGRYPIDGVRVDTVKHVNDEFWLEFLPAITDSATAAGRPDFLIFGEVFSPDPIFNSRYTTDLGFPALLDFRVNDALVQFVGGGASADVVGQAFDDDDWYTDVDSNASMSVSFFGNHDIGRMGSFIDQGTAGASDEEQLDLMKLGFDMLFLTRGTPVVYFGDEQGFVGPGGDKSARQPMFPATSGEYRSQPTIGSELTPGDDNFDPDHPLFVHVSGLNDLRDAHPTLVSGAQVTRVADGAVFAFSRIERTERREYVVVVNRGGSPVSVEVPTSSTDTAFTPIVGEVEGAADGAGILALEVPSRASLVLVADEPLPAEGRPIPVSIVRPESGSEIPTSRYRIEAELGDHRYAEVTFAMALEGGEPVVLGVDDAPPYRLYWNNGALPDGSEVTISVTVSDGSGRPAMSTEAVAVTLGARPSG